MLLIYSQLKNSFNIPLFPSDILIEPDRDFDNISSFRDCLAWVAQHKE
jgi:hypothetical protein